MAPPYARQRQARLLDELERIGALSVSQMATELGVSQMTVRRDVDALVTSGLAIKVHGGATAVTVAGYHRVRTARTLKVGMLVPSVTYYWPPIIKAVRLAAQQCEATVVVRASAYSVEDDRRQLSRLLATPGLDGIIAAPYAQSAASHELFQMLDGCGLPVVLAEREPPPGYYATTLESVATDHAAGAALGIRHLHELGHRQIGILLKSFGPTWPYLVQGVQRTLQDLGLPASAAFHAEAVRHNHPTFERGSEDIIRRCRETGTTALFSHADAETMAFVQWCADHAVQVPGDLSVVAYDDELAHMANPPLTAVRPPKQEVGRIALELLVARINSPSRSRRRVLLAPELVVRKSTNPRG